MTQPAAPVFDRRALLLGAAGLGAAGLSGCATAPPPPARTAGPLTLDAAFLGRTVGSGVFRFPIARVERRFRADLVGTMDGDRLTVVEDFFYEDGETDRLTWVFDRAGPGRWTGRREDTVGTATVIERDGLIELAYLADVRSRGNVTRLGFKDVIWRESADLVINKAVVTWRGLPLGSVLFELRRPA